MKTLSVQCECKTCDIEGCRDGYIPVQDGPDDFILVECHNSIHNND